MAANSHNHGEIHSLDQVSNHLEKEIEHFFISYNSAKDKEFVPLGRYGPDRAKELVDKGRKAFSSKKRGSKKS